MSQSPTLALEGIRVLELANHRAHYCGKLLADLGAEVVKVEPPEGDPTRHQGPFKDDVPDPEGSLSFIYYNTNKLGITLDLARPEGREAFLGLAAAADVVLASCRPAQLGAWGLGYEELRRLKPTLVLASLSGFGQTGRNRDLLAPEIVCTAMGGTMFISGHPDKPPLTPPLELGHQLASVHLALGVLAALYERRSTGRGQHVEVSVQEVLAWHRHLIVNYSSNQIIGARATSGGAAAPSGMYPCADGFVNMHIMAPAHWKVFLRWMGNPPALGDEIWENRHFRALNLDVLDPFVKEFTLALTKSELYRQGQAHHLPVAPINTPLDFAEDPHEGARRFFVQAHHPRLGRYQTPGAPFRLSATPCALRSPAPALGQHNHEIQRLQTPRPAPSGPGTSLKHIRVLDLTQAVAGPYLTRLLAEAGAEVIKFESSTHQQRGRYNPALGKRVYVQQRATFADANHNKLDACLNLGSPQGQALFRRLVQAADVVVENFSPRVMRHWGLDYERLRQERPAIIMVSLPGFGLTGPHADYVSVARIVMAVSGIVHLWGFPGEPEYAAHESWIADYGGGVHGAVAVMAALHHRARTGQGQNIDLSQVEAGACMVGPAYLDYFVNGRVQGPTGNRHPRYAPHGCYRCRGDDRWCVIAAETEEQWQALCEVLGRATWTQDPRFATVQDRLAHQDDLDAHLEEWTRQYTPHQVMGLLQQAGVPAGAVQDAEDLYFDPHLRERGFIVQADDPDLGAIEYPGRPIRYSDLPSHFRRCPEMGQDNDYVYGDLLGMAESEIRALESEGVIA